MPCYDGREYDNSHEISLQRQLKWYKAALCASTAALQKTYDNFFEGVAGHGPNSYLSTIDFKEAGIDKKDFVKWKNEHDREDAARRERERKAAEREARRQELLNAMSPEDKKILGLKG